VNAPFVVAAIILVAALFPLVTVTLRRSLVSGVVALELGGILTTLAIICYAVGTQSSAATALAVITAFMTWLSGLVYVRLMEKQP